MKIFIKYCFQHILKKKLTFNNMELGSINYCAKSCLSYIIANFRAQTQYRTNISTYNKFNVEF